MELLLSISSNGDWNTTCKFSFVPYTYEYLIEDAHKVGDNAPELMIYYITSTMTAILFHPRPQSQQWTGGGWGGVGKIPTLFSPHKHTELFLQCLNFCLKSYTLKNSSQSKYLLMFVCSCACKRGRPYAKPCASAFMHALMHVCMPMVISMYNYSFCYPSEMWQDHYCHERGLSLFSISFILSSTNGL